MRTSCATNTKKNLVLGIQVQSLVLLVIRLSVLSVIGSFVNVFTENKPFQSNIRTLTGWEFWLFFFQRSDRKRCWPPVKYCVWVCGVRIMQKMLNIKQKNAEKQSLWGVRTPRSRWENQRGYFFYVFRI